MKVLTFNTQDPKHNKHFELINMALKSKTYRFKDNEEMRAHVKVLDAVEALSVENEASPGGRTLIPSEEPVKLLLDDAWLSLLKKMASVESTPWLAGSTREVVPMLDFLDAAQNYKAEFPE